MQRAGFIAEFVGSDGPGAAAVAEDALASRPSGRAMRAPTTGSGDSEQFWAPTRAGAALPRGLLLHQSATAVFFTEGGLFDLAGGVAGDPVEDDLPGPLVPGQLLAELLMIGLP